jgi:signal transduction histidine kinase
MDDAERLGKLRHDLANPLAALLAETQLLLMEPGVLTPEVAATLKEIEQLAIRMRTLLREP